MNVKLYQLNVLLVMACKVLKFSRSNSDNSDVTNRRYEYGVAGSDYLILKPINFIDFEVDFSLVYYGTFPTRQVICIGVSNPDLSQPIIYPECPLIFTDGSKLVLSDGLGGSYLVSFSSPLIDANFYRFILNTTGVSLYQSGTLVENLVWNNPIITFTPNTHTFYFGFPLSYPIPNIANTPAYSSNDLGSLNCALCEFKITANQAVTLHVKFGKGYPGPTILSEVGSDVSLYNFGSRLQFSKQDAYIDNDYCCLPKCTTGTYQILITGIALGNPTFSFSSSLTTDEVDLTKFDDCSGYIIPTTEEQISQFLTEGTTVTFTSEGALLEITFTTTEECNTYNVNITGDFFCAKVIGVPKCCVREYDVTSTTRACCVELTEAQAKINTIHEFVLNNFGFTNINKLIGFSKIGASKYEEYLKALDELKDFVLFISLIYSDMACTGNSYTSYISDSEIQKFIDKFYCYNIDIKCILQMANIGNYTGCCEEVTHDTTCPCVDEVPTALPTRFITFNVNGGDIEQVNTEPVTFACCSGDTTVRAIKAKTSSGMPFTATFEQYVQIGMYTLVINFDSDSDFAIEGTNGEINVTLSVCGKTVTQKYIINIINTCVDEYPNPLPLVTIPEIALATADNSTFTVASYFEPFSCCTTPPENPAEQTWEITGITIPSGSGFTYAPNLIGTTGTGNTASVTLGFNVEDANIGTGQIYIYFLLCGKYSIRQDVAFNIIDGCVETYDITLVAPVDTTFNFNTPESIIFTLIDALNNDPETPFALPTVCCNDELVPIEFVSLEPADGSPNPAAFNISIDTSNAPEQIVINYTGHSITDLVSSASFTYNLTLNVCGTIVVFKDLEALTFNFVGNCLACGDIDNNSATGLWNLSSSDDDTFGQTFDFSRTGTYSVAADLETYDLGEFGKHVIMPFFAGGQPDGICLVGGYPPTQTALYSSFTQKDTVINSQCFNLPSLVSEPINTSKHGVGLTTGLKYNGVTNITNDFYTNTSGVLFLRNLTSTRFFSIGKMLDSRHASRAVIYKPICISRSGEPEGYPTTLFSIGNIISINSPSDISDNLIGISGLATYLIKLASRGIYNFTFKLSYEGLAILDGDLTVDNGIGFFARSLNILNNNTCIAASGSSIVDQNYTTGLVANYQDAWAKGLMNVVALGGFTSFPPTMNGIMLGNDDIYYSTTEVAKGTGVGINIINGTRHETYVTFNIKAFADNSIMVLNLFSSNTKTILQAIQELIDLGLNSSPDADFKIELIGNSFTPA